MKRRREYETNENNETNGNRRRFFVCFVIFVCFVFSIGSATTAQGDDRININTASVEELTRLPGVGFAIAARIVEYRRKHGSFKRPQDIVVVRGMSAKRYRRIATLIRI